MNKFELVAELLKLTKFSEEMLMEYSAEELEKTYNQLKNSASNKYWISKYALTQGIFEIEAEKREGYEGAENYIKHKLNGMMVSYAIEGKEWHKTKEEAIIRANELRIKKVASMKKQIAKLEKMEF